MQRACDNRDHGDNQQQGRGPAPQLPQDRQESQQEHAGQRCLPLLQEIHEQVINSYIIYFHKKNIRYIYNLHIIYSTN